MAMTDGGATADAVLCLNDHGKSGQVMEQRRLGGYECPECGRIAESTLTWSDPGDG